MGILTRLGATLRLIRVPQVGDPLWWAPKQLGCAVTQLRPNGVIIFQGGELVRRPSGKLVPRWTVATNAVNARWDEATQTWIVGQGPLPKNVRGDIIRPEPVGPHLGTQPGRVL